MNIVSCAMFAAFLLELPAKPTVDQVADYYREAMTTAAMKAFCRMAAKRKFTPKDIEGMRKTAAMNAADRNPYSWNMTLHPYPDGSGYEARFTKCGICTLMKELGLFESGGNLALGMVPYINDGHGDTPMPGYIMAISPGTCVDTDEEWRRMQALDRLDVAIPAEYMKTAVEIMRHGDDGVPEYMIWLQKGDFTNCPRVTFMYGSDETLYACAPSFEAAMKRYGVDYEMIVGEGMFHCYPVFPICREAKDGWNQMIQRMKENGYD